MGMIRGKIWNPKIFPKYVEVGGPSPIRECKCGKWISNETGEHVEVKIKTWEEFMCDFYKCPHEFWKEGE